jgi:tellurite resistance protein
MIMGLLDRFKGNLEGRLQKLNGNMDFLQGACSAGSLMAMSDGNVSQEEEKSALEAINSNSMLKSAFTGNQIEKTFLEMLSKKGFTGQNQLFRELDDVVQKDPDGKLGMAETCLLVALDVSMGDGDMSDKEKAMAEKIAKRLGLDLSKYL